MASNDNDVRAFPIGSLDRGCSGVAFPDEVLGGDAQLPGARHDRGGGRFALPPNLVDPRVKEATNDELSVLTAQEQEILMLVAEGKTNKEIAAEVFLSDKTVKNYVSLILSKLNLERRAQAAAFVAKQRSERGGL